MKTIAIIMGLTITLYSSFANTTPEEDPMTSAETKALFLLQNPEKRPIFFGPYELLLNARILLSSKDLNHQKIGLESILKERNLVIKLIQRAHNHYFEEQASLPPHPIQVKDSMKKFYEKILEELNPNLNLADLEDRLTQASNGADSAFNQALIKKIVHFAVSNQIIRSNWIQDPRAIRLRVMDTPIAYLAPVFHNDKTLLNAIHQESHRLFPELYPVADVSESESEFYRTR